MAKLYYLPKILEYQPFPVPSVEQLPLLLQPVEHFLKLKEKTVKKDLPSITISTAISFFNKLLINKLNSYILCIILLYFFKEYGCVYYYDTTIGHNCNEQSNKFI